MSDIEKLKQMLGDHEERISKLEAALYSSSWKLRKETAEKKSKDAVEKIDANKLQFLTSLNSVLDKCLALLSYVSEHLRQSSGLTTDELKEILADKFGLTTITPNNISMSLKNVTGKYVTRKKISDKTEKYSYQILEKGNQYIKKKIAILQQSEK
jgi:hypothetical protein